MFEAQRTNTTAGDFPDASYLPKYGMPKVAGVDPTMLKLDFDYLLAEIPEARPGNHLFNMQACGSFDNGVVFNVMWGQNTLGAEQGKFEIAAAGYAPYTPPYKINEYGIGCADMQTIVDFLTLVRRKDEPNRPWTKNEIGQWFDACVKNLPNTKWIHNPFNDYQVVGRFQNGCQFSCIYGPMSYGRSQGLIEIKVNGYGNAEHDFDIDINGFGAATPEQLGCFLSEIAGTKKD